MKLAGLCLVAMVAVAGAIGVRASMPAGAQGGGHFALDMNIDNGVCGPVDTSASVGQSGTLKVGICWVNSTEPPLAFQVDVGYDTAFLTAPEGDESGGALDDNPDANAGLTTFGTQTLGAQWDCTAFGVSQPFGDNPATPGGNATITCNGNITNPDLHLTNGALAVITFQTGTKAGTTQLSFLDDTSGAGNNNTSYLCTDVACDGASLTVGGVAATATPVTPTPGPTEAAAATATRVTFDATQAALPNGANTGGSEVSQTQTALQQATPASTEEAATIAANLQAVNATGTAIGGEEAIAQQTTEAQVTAAAVTLPGNTDSNDSGDSGGDSNTGLFAGIGIGAVILLAAAAGGGYWVYRRRQAA